MPLAKQEQAKKNHELMETMEAIVALDDKDAIKLQLRQIRLDNPAFIGYIVKFGHVKYLAMFLDAGIDPLELLPLDEHDHFDNLLASKATTALELMNEKYLAYKKAHARVLRNLKSNAKNIFLSASMTAVLLMMFRTFMANNRLRKAVNDFLVKFPLLSYIFASIALIFAAYEIVTHASMSQFTVWIVTGFTLSMAEYLSKAAAYILMIIRSAGPLAVAAGALFIVSACMSLFKNIHSFFKERSRLRGLLTDPLATEQDKVHAQIKLHAIKQQVLVNSINGAIAVAATAFMCFPGSAALLALGSIGVMLIAMTVMTIAGLVSWALDARIIKNRDTKIQEWNNDNIDKLSNADPLDQPSLYDDERSLSESITQAKGTAPAHHLEESAGHSARYAPGFHRQAPGVDEGRSLDEKYPPRDAPSRKPCPGSPTRRSH